VRWRRWLRHCTTRQQVAGSISDGGHWNCSRDLIILPAFSSPRAHSVSRRNEYEGISLRVKATGA
jgi:hypothetical protein